MVREQFTFYASFARAVKRIRKPAERAAAYDAIVDYALYGIMPDLEALSDTAAVAFELARPNLDASRRKAENGMQKGRAARTGEEAAKSKRKQNDARGGPVQEQAGCKREYEPETEYEPEEEPEKKNECYPFLSFKESQKVSSSPAAALRALSPWLDGGEASAGLRDFPAGFR